MDDSDVISRLLARILEQAGHEPVEVLDPAELRNPSSPLWLDTDVLLCDLKMPDVSGVEILSVAATYFPHIRRLAFTGLSAHDTEAVAAGALAHRVLLKPDDVLHVAAIVGETNR